MTQAAAPVAAPAGLPPFRALPDLLRENALARPGHVALRQGGRSLTWAALDASIDRVAAGLQRDGLRPRDSIAICGVNSIAYLEVFLGGLRAGLAVAPLPTGALPEQLAGMVKDCGARLFFCDADVPAVAGTARRVLLAGEGGGTLRDWLPAQAATPSPVGIAPEWAFNIIYSSGTTGTPKGIVQPHAMRWAHVARGETHGYGPQAVTLVATSLCSNTTLVSVFPCLAKGGTVVLTEGRFDAAAYLALAGKARATHAMLVPVQYQRLMAVPDFDRFDLSSFHMKFCTSAPFAAALKADVLARWPGGLVEYYGMTEG
ncbi:MAG: long-chain fatty acid--CoA ligase, partial [Comamonadaceae bacterium]